MVVLAFSFITLCLELVIMSVRQDTPYYKKWSYPVFGLTVNSICFAISLVLIVLIIKRLTKKGTSPRLRMIIVVRYLILYVVFLG